MTSLKKLFLRRVVISFTDMQLNAKSRQNFQGVTTPAASPNRVKLPSSTVRDRNDNGKLK